MRERVEYHRVEYEVQYSAYPCGAVGMGCAKNGDIKNKYVYA